MSTQTDKAAKRFPFDIWLNKHQQGRSVLQQGKYEGYLAALSELDAQPSPTEDLEARAQRFFMAWPNGDIPAMLAAFARSLAQPSAPTVERIMVGIRPYIEMRGGPLAYKDRCDNLRRIINAILNP